MLITLKKKYTEGSGIRVRPRVATEVELLGLRVPTTQSGSRRATAGGMIRAFKSK